jgi:hypothetical protein
MMNDKLNQTCCLQFIIHHSAFIIGLPGLILGGGAFTLARDGNRLPAVRLEKH